MELTAQKRSPGGARQLKSGGRVPAIVYNRETNIPVSVELREFDRVFRSQGTSRVIDLDIEGDKKEVLVKAVQMNKRSRLPEHVDFYVLTAGQKVDVSVKINFVGTPIGVRNGGLDEVHRRELQVSILPRLIPGTIDVDITELEIGDSIHVSDIVGLLPDEAEILDDLDNTVLAVVPPRVEIEPSSELEEDEFEPEEPEVISKGKEEDEDEE